MEADRWDQSRDACETLSGRVDGAWQHRGSRRCVVVLLIPVGKTTKRTVSEFIPMIQIQNMFV
jgi:hypothetical protein